MPIITQALKDITWADAQSPVVFNIPAPRLGSDGVTILQRAGRTIRPVDGVISVYLDPGPATVYLSGRSFAITVPTVDCDLKSLIAGSLSIPPGVPDSAIAQAVVDYLTAHPPEAGGAVGFTHAQTSPAATWTIANPLGRFPRSVDVFVGGSQVTTDVDTPDTSTIVVTFASPVSGRAEIL